MTVAQQMLCESCWCADGKVFMAIIRKLFWRLLYGCGSWQWSPICLSEHLYSPARSTISTKEHELKHYPAQSVFFLTVDNEADLHDSESQQISLPAQLVPVSPAGAVTDLSLNSHGLSCSTLMLCIHVRTAGETSDAGTEDFMSSERASADLGSVWNGWYKTVCVCVCVCVWGGLCVCVWGGGGVCVWGIFPAWMDHTHTPLIGCLTLPSLKCVSRALRSPNWPLQQGLTP